jgi:hypothetical protein
VFEKKATHTDQLLRFLAGTHMPNLTEVVQWGSTIRPSRRTPWWKAALIRAASGDILCKCSYIDLNMLDMTLDHAAAAAAAMAFLDSWRVEERLIDEWRLDLGGMLDCTRTVLSHLPKDLVHLCLS